jgi:hypothetical protein
MAFSRSIIAAAVASAAVLSTPTPALAQSAAAPAQPIAKADQPYFDLYDAIIGGLDLDQMSETGADAVFDGMIRNSTEFGSFAKSQPDLKREFRTIAKPFLLVWIKRAMALKRDPIAAKFKEQLTPQEASELAGFYRSQLGRKVMKAISNNISASNTVDSAIKNGGKTVDKGAVRNDEADTMSAALQELLPSLTVAEQKEMIAFSKTSAFRKLEGATEAMQSVPEPSFDQIATEEEKRAFGLALGELFRKAKARQ